MDDVRTSRFTPEERREIVLTLLAEREAMAELCRRHNVSSTAIYHWRDQFLEAGMRGLQGQGPTQREAALERENRELKQLIGDIAVVNYALKRGIRGSTGNTGGRS